MATSIRPLRTPGTVQGRSHSPEPTSHSFAAAADDRSSLPPHRPRVPGLARHPHPSPRSRPTTSRFPQGRPQGSPPGATVPLGRPVRGGEEEEMHASSHKDKMHPTLASWTDSGSLGTEDTCLSTLFSFLKILPSLVDRSSPRATGLRTREGVCLQRMRIQLLGTGHGLTYVDSRIQSSLRGAGLTPAPGPRQHLRKQMAPSIYSPEGPAV